MIARVTMSEASTQAFEVQVAVAQTVINRLHSGIFGSDIRDIVYSEDQFSTADNGEPNEQVLLAVKEAIMSMPYPSNMYYFRQWYYHSWAVDYKKIGDLYFSLEPCDN
jgi:spore germination cell wall hydrolase CwlJ-like protein